MKSLKAFVLGAALVATGLYVVAVSVPYTFQPNTPIKANEVNQNFSVLKSAVDALEADGFVTLKKLKTKNEPGPGQVLSYDGEELAWRSVAGVTGVINSVTAGTGLSGGGVSGDVTLGIASAGVTSPLLANGAVTEAKLGNGSVTNPKIAQGAVAGFQVLDGSIGGVEIADGSLTGQDFAAPLDLSADAANDITLEVVNLGSGAIVGRTGSLKRIVAGSGAVTGEAANGAGVLAVSVNGVGVAASTENPQEFAGVFVGGRGIDVRGSKSVFSGDLQVVGKLTALGGKNFKIDHPLDPANKYLIHAAVESPEVKNIYDGTVVTNADGLVTVQLPDYFEALNKNYRYQLTVIGGFAQAVVKEEVRGNRFVIQTDKPGVKVSWQVTGVRQDPYMADHPMRVEVEKTGEERGTYLYPQGYGKPTNHAAGAR